MGRVLKRVPMDFDWPMHKRWDGYANPHYRECPDCESGYTVDRRWLQAITHLLLVAGEDGQGRRDPLHPWLQAVGYRPTERPTKAMAELSGGLAGRAPRAPFGHDACDRWGAEKAIIKAAGLDDETWGICPTCKGDAIDPACREAYDAWTEYDPPTGDGYQLWETTSEGSPTSPVFASLDALCEWAGPNASFFGNTKVPAATWRDILSGDGASGLITLKPSTGEMTVDGQSLAP